MIDNELQRAIIFFNNTFEDVKVMGMTVITIRTRSSKERSTILIVSWKSRKNLKVFRHCCPIKTPMKTFPPCFQILNKGAKLSRTLIDSQISTHYMTKGVFFIKSLCIIHCGLIHKKTFNGETTKFSCGFITYETIKSNL